MKKITYITLLSLLFAGFTATAGEMTPKQLKNKEKYFLKFDANSDKGLSRSEFVEMTRTQFVKKSKTGWEAEGTKRFSNNDHDKDGIVYFDEWMAQQKKVK